jgi:AraC-like DNA-binding protein
MRENYKFEKFRDQNFPVYSSCQQGSGLLVVPHFHKAAELILVTQGEVTFSINTQRHRCGCGDMMFIPPYSVHSVESCEDAAIRGMTFELQLIREGAFGISAETILSKGAVTEYVFQDGSCEPLKNCFLQAVDVYKRNEATYKLEMLSSLYQITALLIRRFFGSYEAYKGYDRMQPVIDYISRNYHREMDLSELSGLLNVCNDHFIRLFRSATNKTPAAYIRDFRLQEALKLLLGSDMSVTEIASEVGFSSGNYMTRVFHTAFGMTPVQYRKHNRRV